jgi:hypothetical protein
MNSCNVTGKAEYRAINGLLSLRAPYAANGHAPNGARPRSVAEGSSAGAREHGYQVENQSEVEIARPRSSF